MLNLSQLRSFVSLAETGSFQDAAARLQIAQPTISQHIKKLENDLGVVLIERSNARSRSTRHGERLLPYARSLLRTAERAAAVARGSALVVGCSGNIAGYYMSRAIKRFLDADGWTGGWEVRTAPNPQIADMLRSREVDLAAMEWPMDEPGIAVEPWRRAEMIVILPPDHAFAGREAITVDEFLTLRLIGGESGSGTGTALRGLLGSRAGEVAVAANVGSTEAVKSAVKAGLGASVVLEAAVADDVQAGRLARTVVEAAPLFKTFYVARPATLPDDDVTARFARCLMLDRDDSDLAAAGPPVG